MHLIGAYTGTIVGSSGNRNRMHQFAGFLGRKPDFQMDFINGATFATMAEPWIPQGWRKFGATTMVITVPLIPVQAGGAAATLAAAAAGTYNSNYANLMAKYQECGFQNAIIRLGHEFNGTWYPWRADQGREAVFVGAWRQASRRSATRRMPAAAACRSASTGARHGARHPTATWKRAIPATSTWM